MTSVVNLYLLGLDTHLLELGPHQHITQGENVAKFYNIACVILFIVDLTLELALRDLWLL